MWIQIGEILKMKNRNTSNDESLTSGSDENNVGKDTLYPQMEGEFDEVTDNLVGTDLPEYVFGHFRKGEFGLVYTWHTLEPEANIRVRMPGRNKEKYYTILQ